jgi:4-azaleucine resistance transporter AzlC
MNSVNIKPGSASLCIEAALDTLPLAIAVIPWGVLTGAMAIQIGLSAMQAQFMSLLIFAGAAQLSGMTLMASGASFVALLGSTFVISSRHLLYSMVFREHVIALPFMWRVSIAMVLTDEMFAVSQAHTSRTGHFSPLFALVSGITFYLVWNTATLVGIIAGDSFDNLESLGLDFAIAATFIAMTFDQLRRLPILIAVLISGSLAVVLKPFLSDSYILVATLVGMTSAFAVEKFNQRKAEA